MSALPVGNILGKRLREEEAKESGAAVKVARRVLADKQEVDLLLNRLAEITDRKYVPTGNYLTQKTKTIESIEQIDGIPIERLEKEGSGGRESLKKTLKSAWEIVEKAGWTHQALADALHEIGSNAESKTMVNYGGRNYAVSFMRFRAIYSDVFEKYSWNTQCRIKWGAHQVIWDLGREGNIRDYGFYGDEESTRIDPKVLIEMLGGPRSKEIL